MNATNQGRKLFEKELLRERVLVYGDCDDGTLSEIIRVAEVRLGGQQSALLSVRQRGISFAALCLTLCIWILSSINSLFKLPDVYLFMTSGIAYGVGFGG
ncbi:MAG: hypothetical protein P4L64_10835 [Caulobacteraceae bacterium]|nr:hypothetical protein [Caulobacteraceae bacterium]